MSSVASIQAPETRGLRLRPDATHSEEHVVEQIEAAAEAGFNLIIMDVFRRGFSVFPSTTCRRLRLPSPRREWRKHDLLAAACRTALENDMAIVASIDCLDQGPADQFPRSPFLGSRFSQWWFQHSPPRRFQLATATPSHVYLCPSHPEVRQFLGQFATEVADHYPVTGILLDGMWNPQGSACYCATCRKAKIEMSPVAPDMPVQPGSGSHGELLSDFLSAIKARARKARRTLHFYGTRPPESIPGLEQGLFDVLYVASAAESESFDTMSVTHVSSGPVHVTDLSQNIEEVRRHSPAGWLLELENLEVLAKSPAAMTSADASPCAESNPSQAAVYYLEAAASIMNLPAMGEAAAAISADPANSDLLETALGKAEAALQSANTRVQETADRNDGNLLQAIAYLRLAISSTT